MADDSGIHVDDDWKKQAREEKRRLAEQEAARKAAAEPASQSASKPDEDWAAGAGLPGEVEGGGYGGDIGTMAAAGTMAGAEAPAPGAGGGSAGRAGGGSPARHRARRGSGQLPPPTFETLVETLAGQAMIYLGGAATAGGEPIIDLDTARHQIDLLATLEDKTTGNLSESEQQALDTSLYEARSRFCRVAQRYIL